VVALVHQVLAGHQLHKIGLNTDHEVANSVGPTGSPGTPGSPRSQAAEQIELN
jgi:hypothetical protein